MNGLYAASGELDLLTAPGLAAGMREAIDEAVDRDVVVDFAAVTFMDTGAYHALVEANRYAAARDHRLVIRNLQPICARVLTLCDHGEELTYELASR